MAINMKARAIVAHASTDAKPDLRMEDVEISPIKDGELLVEMVATGICHSDLTVASMPESEGLNFPRVLGHEGIGWVREVGSAVTVAKPGDAVALSFTSCGHCCTCSAAHVAFCKDFTLLNLVTFRGPSIKRSGEVQADTSGHFFGQSSFASLSRVEERAVVNVSKWVKDEEDMIMLAPMGCGFQTGSATVEKLAGAGPKDVVVVIGLGGVGMAAVMAAKIIGCRQIIGVDRVKSRIELAKELGATDVINTAEADLVAEVKRLTDDAGSTITVDASGVPALIQQAVLFTGIMGKLVLIGAPAPTATLELNIVSTISNGFSVIGSIEGDAVPAEHIPRMIEWFREGKFPVDKLIKTYPAAEFQTAIHDMHTGATIKPVLLWK